MDIYLRHLSRCDDFQHFCQQLGLENANTARWHSPFNFRESALLYVPPDLPEPRENNYTQALVEAAIPVLKISKGGHSCYLPVIAP